MEPLEKPKKRNSRNNFGSLIAISEEKNKSLVKIRPMSDLFSNNTKRIPDPKRKTISRGNFEPNEESSFDFRNEITILKTVIRFQREEIEQLKSKIEFLTSKFKETEPEYELKEDLNLNKNSNKKISESKIVPAEIQSSENALRDF